jgi:hypothetical protein
MRVAPGRDLEILAGPVPARVSARVELAVLESLMVAAMAAFGFVFLV